jgi:hypothetical protein
VRTVRLSQNEESLLQFFVLNRLGVELDSGFARCFEILGARMHAA